MPPEKSPSHRILVVLNSLRLKWTGQFVYLCIFCHSSGPPVKGNLGKASGVTELPMRLGDTRFYAIFVPEIHPGTLSSRGYSKIAREIMPEEIKSVGFWPQVFRIAFRHTRMHPMCAGGFRSRVEDIMPQSAWCMSAAGQFERLRLFCNQVEENSIDVSQACCVHSLPTH